MESLAIWSLLTLQIALGLLDILYHHEFTERLGWKKTQVTELYLHAARNAIYGLIFGLFAFFWPTGWIAFAVIIILLAEIIITLHDFIEEDRTRKLPWSERILHTLLAINFGALLALLLPELWIAGLQPTGLNFVIYGTYGVGSAILAIASFGCLFLAVREIWLTKRMARLGLWPAAELATSLKRRHRFVITGGTGFVGQRLVNVLSQAGHAVIVLTRDPVKAGEVLEPPFTTVTSLDQIPAHLPIDAVISLAGESVAGGRWTQNRRDEIINSRLMNMRGIKHFIERLDHRPESLIVASAIGYYGLRGDEWLDESASGDLSFSHESTMLLEAAAAEASGQNTGENTRLVALRLGLVLGYEGGLLGQLLPVFDWGVGGPTGSGEQWMSWIERDDLVRVILHAATTPTLEGPVNAVSPNPVRNKDFASAMGQALHRPAFLPLPTFIVRLIFGQMGEELLLSGQRVRADKLQASGFKFEYPMVEHALEYAVGSKPKEQQKRIITIPPINPAIEKQERKI